MCFISHFKNYFTFINYESNTGLLLKKPENFKKYKIKSVYL